MRQESSQINKCRAGKGAVLHNEIDMQAVNKFKFLSSDWVVSPIVVQSRANPKLACLHHKDQIGRVGGNLNASPLD